MHVLCVCAREEYIKYTIIIVSTIFGDAPSIARLLQHYNTQIGYLDLVDNLHVATHYSITSYSAPQGFSGMHSALLRVI